MTYVGIDLGTTNSAIASYDGESVRLYKSPEQHDVTPSAIYATKRRRFVGWHAYNQSAANPRNAATLFKRFMGTSTPIHFEATGETITPVDASSEVLAALFAYLPEEIRENPDTGTVITVPAAFNQMQRNATLDAATQANLGKVALMQEPVAAVMSAMAQDCSDGIFMIYDLGGGTLDIAIAESVGGRVSLLSHGGVAMLGGRDMDRLLFDNIVKPWLYETFNLPVDATRHPEYEKLIRLAVWATERAKIELSRRDITTVSLSEEETRVQDLEGTDVYLDVPLQRDQLDRLIAPLVRDSVGAARDATKQAGVSPHDISRIVFVGGPTQYPPLREQVAFELGIRDETTVNPMTAVATGAAIFAESIDWSQESRGRKRSRAEMATGTPVSFKYEARTPSEHAKVAAVIEGNPPEGIRIEFTSLTTGWTSGSMPLLSNEIYTLPLPNQGIHKFRVTVLDATGRQAELNNNLIEVTRTASSVEAIPASHTVSIEAQSKSGGSLVLVSLVQKGDTLPVSGSRQFIAATTVVAGNDEDSINFKLWEGEITERIYDNHPVGTLSIKGTDLQSGRIEAGTALECNYEIHDSGVIKLQVVVPGVDRQFRKDDFYTRSSAERDFSNQDELYRLLVEQDSVIDRIEVLEEHISDHRLDEARSKLERIDHEALKAGDVETAKQSSESVLEAKRLIDQVRQDNRETILQNELDRTIERFNTQVREYAQPSEEAQFDNLTRTAQRLILEGSREADERMYEMRSLMSRILWRQDPYIVDWFEHLTRSPWLFSDKEKFDALVQEGRDALERNDMNRVRAMVYQLTRLQHDNDDKGDDDSSAEANIIYMPRTRPLA